MYSGHKFVFILELSLHSPLYTIQVLIVLSQVFNDFLGTFCIRPHTRMDNLVPDVKVGADNIFKQPDNTALAVLQWFINCFQSLL